MNEAVRGITDCHSGLVYRQTKQTAACSVKKVLMLRQSVSFNMELSQVVFLST